MRSTTKTVNSGSFTCPRCGPGRTYEHKQVNGAAHAAWARSVGWIGPVLVHRHSREIGA